jgi:hypothetical protein
MVGPSEIAGVSVADDSVTVGGSVIPVGLMGVVLSAGATGVSLGPSPHASIRMNKATTATVFFCINLLLVGTAIKACKA